MTAWPGARRRRRRRPVIVAGLVVAILAAAGIAAWCNRHRAAQGMAHGPAPQDASFDRDALDRAAGEGMVPVIDRHDAPRRASGVIHALSAVAQLV